MSEWNKVLWSEGLFLRTQHFQQQDRYVESLVRGAISATPLQAFGFLSLELDDQALQAGLVAIKSAAGVFPDGTPFHIPETMDAPEPIPVGSDCASGVVRLGIPIVANGAPAFDPAHGDRSGARFHGQIVQVRDAVRNGAEIADIEVARLCPKLIQPDQSSEGFVSLGIAEVAGLASDGSVSLVANFIPPALSIGAVPTYRQFLKELILGLDRIAIAHSGIVLGSSGRSVENLMVLQLANSAKPEIAHVLAQDHYHPSELFRLLSRLAGQMSTFGSSGRVMSDLPAYDHNNPTAAFAAVFDTLRSLVQSLRHVEPKSQPLTVATHAKNVWKVRIDDPNIIETGRIVLRVGSGLSEDSLRKIFVDQATVGSSDEFEKLWRVRLRGIPLKPLHTQPREIPYDGDRLCIELDQRSEHWQSLANAPGFVLGVSGDLPDEPKIDCYAIFR